MAQKELLSGSQSLSGETDGEVKKIARFLRILTWQMFALLALLLFLVLRPQAGRYQFTVVGEDVGVFDTSNSQAWMIKLQRKSVTPGDKVEPGTAPPTEGKGPAQ